MKTLKKFIEEKEATKKIQIDALFDAIKNSNAKKLKPAIWKGRRIYFNSGHGKDIKAYIEFDFPENTEYDDPFDGAALKVFSNANQTRQWLINRAKQVKHSIMQDLVNAKITPSLAKITVPSDWKDIILS